MAMAHKHTQITATEHSEKKNIWEFGKLKQQHIKLVG